MRPLIGVIALVGLAFLLAEFFIVFLLPRRVRRDPAIARGVLRALWIPWRAGAGLLPRGAADTMLGIFGPLGLLAILLLLSSGVILCFAGLHWAVSTELGSHHVAEFGSDLYFSAGAFFSATNPSTPLGGAGKVLQIAEAATGLGFLAIAIGYLPALYQAFSRREAAVARLDPRAGSPPSAGRLLERSGQRGGWPELDEYLLECETWTAEVMETHLSYPILGYFRSQHVNQNWLAALTTIVDACAYALAYGPEDSTQAPELTFRIVDRDQPPPRARPVRLGIGGRCARGMARRGWAPRLTVIRSVRAPCGTRDPRRRAGGRLPRSARGGRRRPPR